MQDYSSRCIEVRPKKGRAVLTEPRAPRHLHGSGLDRSDKREITVGSLSSFCRVVRDGESHESRGARIFGAHQRNDGAAWYRASRGSITAIEFAVCNGAASMRRLSI